MELEVGAIVEGKVSGITKFGAFVSLPGGRSGLVHISEIAYSYVNDVKDHLTEGQEVKVKIIGVDESNRINLSIKKAMDPPPRPQGQGNRPPMDRGNRPPMDRGSRPPQGQQGNGAPRPNYSPRPNNGGYGNNQGGYGGGRSGGYVRPAPGPESFEDRLKQFMQNSDSKLSEMKYTEKKNNRRTGRK